MKSILLGLLFTLPMAVSAMADELVAEPVPTSGGDGSGALILLAMVGVVIATGSGMMATRNANSLDIEADDADDNAGF